MTGVQTCALPIFSTLVSINKKSQDILFIGNLDAKRDWGYAPEYVEGMYKMLQQDRPDDFVLATGKAHSVRDFIEYVSAYLGLGLEWRGICGAMEEVGFSKTLQRDIVHIDAKYFRPAEVNFLLGDASKAKRILGWEHKTDFRELIKIMIAYEKAKTTKIIVDKAFELKSGCPIT